VVTTSPLELQIGMAQVVAQGFKDKRHFILFYCQCGTNQLPLIFGGQK
jgi:hypothetical protein